jgi:hypothetical protein
MIRKLFLTFIAMAAFVGVSHAQTKPDFSGTWKLDVSKSQFSEYGGPSARTDVVTQDGDKFMDKVVAASDQGNSSFTVTFTVGAKPLDVPADSPAANQGMLTLKRISAVWQDASLVVSQDMTYQGQYDFSTTLTYVLSEGGKTLTVTSHSATQAGDIVTKFVFAKQ